jgi:prepilin-type N-terminal cleavage/methylation domain-containing protein
MSRRGFTLLELIVVIVIIGVLATLGLTQYGRMVERARGAEARAILGDIRKLATAYRLQYGTVTGFASTDANIGTGVDNIPSACAGTHYFSYSSGTPADPTITITATRCTTGGRTPQGLTAGTLILTTNITSGVDAWSGTGGY